MVEDAMALYKFSNLWPKLDKSLLAQMKAEEKIFAQENGKIFTWALGFYAFLKSKGEDVTINNRWFVDFITSRQFPLLNLALTKILARTQLNKVCGVNPVVQDNLSMDIQDFEDAIPELTDDEEALNLCDDMVDSLFNYSDHLEIGHRLGMDDFTLGVYDALRGLIYKSFSPRYIDAAVSLSAWLRECMNECKPVTMELLGEQISSLSERFNLLIPVANDAANYILMDILQEAKD